MSWSRVLFAFALVAGAGLAVAPLAGAGGEAPSDPLDALRSLIPEGEPGEFDLQEGVERYGEYVALYGAVAETSEFGDGSELSGPCGGYAISFDSSGERLDAAMDVGDGSPPIDMLDGGQAFTASNRFKVDTNGVVAYFGFFPETGDGPRDHTWSIVTGGISIDEGGDPNDDAKNRNAGIVDLAEQLPVKFNANVKIQGEMFSDLPDCIGKGHVEFIATGVTPMQIGSIAALAGGIFGLLFNARPAMTYKG